MLLGCHAAPLGSCVLLPKTAPVSSTTPLGAGNTRPSTASGDSEDKRLQPHHFHITNDSLHFKGWLPPLAPAFSAQQGHWDLCPVLQGGSAGICYYCSCSFVLPLLQRGACRSFWSSCLTVGFSRRAQGCWHPPPVLCSGTIQGAAGHPKQQG